MTRAAVAMRVTGAINEYNDESDGGDEANKDDVQWGTHTVDVNCENLA